MVCSVGGMATSVDYPGVCSGIAASSHSNVGQERAMSAERDAAVLLFLAACGGLGVFVLALLIGAVLTAIGV